MTKARDLASAPVAPSTVSSTELGYVDGVTSAIQTQINAKAPTSTTVTLTGVQTMSGKTLHRPIIAAPREQVTVLNTSAGGTIQFEIIDRGLQFHRGNSTSDWTLNVTGVFGGATLDSVISINDSITVTLLVTNTTAYKHTALTIDGAAQTVKWSGGTAPSAGNASAIDAYSFTIIKTASATYTVLGAGPIKYA